MTSHFASLLGYSGDVRASPPQPRVPYKNTSPALAGKDSSAVHPTARHQNPLVRFVKLKRYAAGRSARCNKRLLKEYIPPVDLFLENNSDGSYSGWMRLDILQDEGDRVSSHRYVSYSSYFILVMSIKDFAYLIML